MGKQKKQEEVVLSTESKKIINVIEKINNNVNDASYGKNKINIYYNLSQEVIAELIAAGYKIESGENDNCIHNILW